MGWEFAGFFACAHAEVTNTALERWPGVRGRLIAEPFQGVGIGVPERALTYDEPEGSQEAAQELAWAVEQDLPVWSAQFSATTFVFLRADCFGGHCIYEGYVCQKGEILVRAQDDQEESDDGGAALRKLVVALGVELPDPPVFAPFVRGFFESGA
jgi:hypothetical protein